MVSRSGLPVFRRRLPRRKITSSSSRRGTVGRLAEPHLAFASSDSGRTPRGVHDKPPTAAVRRLLHPSVCVPGQGSWPIQPISCPGKAARALRHVRYTPSSRSRRSKISDPPTSPLPRPPFACFDWLGVLAHSVLLWLRLHQVSTSSYLLVAIPTSCAPRPLAVLSGIILSFSLGDLPVPGHRPAVLAIPRTLSSPKPTIPSLVIAESACYMRKRRQQA